MRFGQPDVLERQTRLRAHRRQQRHVLARIRLLRQPRPQHQQPLDLARASHQRHQRFRRQRRHRRPGAARLQLRGIHQHRPPSPHEVHQLRRPDRQARRRRPTDLRGPPPRTSSRRRRAGTPAASSGAAPAAPRDRSSRPASSGRWPYGSAPPASSAGAARRRRRGRTHGRAAPSPAARCGGPPAPSGPPKSDPSSSPPRVRSISPSNGTLSNSRANPSVTAMPATTATVTSPRRTSR